MSTLKMCEGNSRTQQCKHFTHMRANRKNNLQAQFASKDYNILQISDNRSKIM